MYWLLLPPDANTQRQLDTPTVPLGFAWQHALDALRARFEALRALFH